MKITIDKEKFIKGATIVGLQNRGKVVRVDLEQLEELLDQATIKDSQEEECIYCGGDNSEIEHIHQQPNKPTPEPKECKHKCCEMPCRCDCRDCGIKESPKVPEKLDSNTSNFWDIVLQLNRVIDYLKEKEE